MGATDWVAYAVIVLGVLFCVLSLTDGYQAMSREAERNRVVAAELGALKDMVGVSDATRQVIHSTIAGLDTGDHGQSLFVKVLLAQMRGAAEFLLVDVLNSRLFILTVLAAILGAASYLVHGMRSK